MATYYWKHNRRNQLKGGKGQVSLCIYFPDDKVALWRSTKVWVSPSDWDDKTNYLRRRMPEFKVLDKRLRDFKNKFEAIEADVEVFTPDILKEYLKQNVKNYDNTFVRWMEVTINNMRGVATGTTDNYRAALRLLKEYDPNLSFAKIVRRETIEEINNMLLGRNYSPGTIWRYHKDIKKFLYMAVRQNRVRFVHGLSPYSGMVISRQADEDNVVLSEEDIQKLYDFNFRKLPMLERARDLFLIGYYTLTRFGDYSELKRENFVTIKRDDKEIEVMQRIPEKTFDKTITIPVHPNLKAIMMKYRYNPPRMSNQKLNNYIKEVCAYAGISDPVQIAYTRGGVRHRKTKPKHQLVETHTARRSGATNLIRMGVPARKVMMLTGHSTEASFNKYVKMSGEDVAFDLSNMDYYTT